MEQVKWDNNTVRQVERDSIRSFVMSCADHLTGRVLDYGCGQQPYRGIVEAAGGNYVGYDRVQFPGNVSRSDVGHIRGTYDAILCNQMLQFVPLYAEGFTPKHDVLDELLQFFHFTLSGVPAPSMGDNRHGHLILTYTTSWAEVEEGDLTRFTRAGMERLLTGAGFEVLRHEERAAIDLGGFRLPLGYGVLARA